MIEVLIFSTRLASSAGYATEVGSTLAPPVQGLRHDSVVNETLALPPGARQPAPCSCHHKGSVVPGALEISTSPSSTRAEDTSLAATSDATRDCAPVLVAQPNVASWLPASPQSFQARFS